MFVDLGVPTPEDRAARAVETLLCRPQTIGTCAGYAASGRQLAEELAILLSCEEIQEKAPKKGWV